MDGPGQAIYLEKKYLGLAGVSLSGAVIQIKERVRVAKLYSIGAQWILL